MKTFVVAMASALCVATLGARAAQPAQPVPPAVPVAPSAAQVQPQPIVIEAARFRTADGVEILVPRGSMPAPAGMPATPPVSPSTATPAVAPMVTALPTANSAVSIVAAPTASIASPSGSVRAATAELAAPRAGGHDASRAAFRVDGEVQAARDDERRRILLAELLTEGEALDHKRRTRKNPRAAFDLSSEQLRKLDDDVRRHEVNVKALERELALLRSASEKATRPTM